MYVGAFSFWYFWFRISIGLDGKAKSCCNYQSSRGNTFRGSCWLQLSGVFKPHLVYKPFSERNWCMRYSVGSRRRKPQRSQAPKPKEPVKTRAKPVSRRVTSAGGVVLRQNGGNLEVLLIALKEGRVWSLPKGQVESGERYRQTALREVQEETGIKARILASIGSIRYHFTVKDDGIQTTITKEVHHFLMVYLAGQPTPQKEEVDLAEWCGVPEAFKQLSHHNERDVLKRALTRWEALDSAPR
jgi:8-oxo-dGTP pyrophosphatase MutT (NUDIX family)